MSDRPIYASLMIDDPPANASYWARYQQVAFGYAPSERGGWGTNWRAMEPMAWYRPEDAQEFADMCEEFGVRGKFSFLPCPAGQGRVDQHVRAYEPEKFKELVRIVRDRIAMSFDITPEVLTHSMALDVKTMGLLPHSETHWLTHMCVTRQLEAVREYLSFGYRVLQNAGIPAHGVSVGGMNDVSGIAQGKEMWKWDGTSTLGEVLLSVEREFDSTLDSTFMFIGGKPISEKSQKLRIPDVMYTAPGGGRAYAVHTAHEDVAFPLLHGPGDQLEKTIDAMITPDYSEGLLVREAEAGRVVAFSAHAQTLNSMNTGSGTKAIREAIRRLTQRYGKRIQWKTAREICEIFKTTAGAP